ncbi:MAG: rhodanese-like domain-containing protein [Flavobacteriia bacterium]|nr:rhodanese-like domain-containing protein [Flavobacteriia bacterium]
MQYITTSQLKEALLSSEEITVIDIRESYERNICTIISIHIPMGELNQRQVEIPREGRVVIMCKTGRRAEASTNYLEKEFGFTNLFFLSGGIIEWIEKFDNQLEIY